MRKQQNFWVNKLKYLEEAVTLKSTYSANRIDEIVDAISQLHISFSKQEGILNGKQAYWYRDNILERRMVWIVLIVYYI